MLIDQGAAVFRGAALLAQTGQLPVQQQHVARRAALGPECRALGLDHRLVGGGEDGAVELGKRQVARSIDHDLDTERFIQAQNRPGLHGPRGVMLSGDHHDRRVRQARA